MSTSSNPIESSGMRRASCRPTKVLSGHTRSVKSVAYFPDGRRLASASDDKTVIIWDVESGRQDGQPLHHDSIVRWLAISPDGRRIASGMQEGGAVIWDVLKREVVHELRGGGVRRLAYSPDGSWIVSAPVGKEREIQLWDADTGRPGREPLKCSSRVSCVTFSPDGARTAVGLEDGSFQVIDISTGGSVIDPVKGHTKSVWSVVYSPDGCLLVTASWDKTIRVWDSKTGVEVGKPMGYDANIIGISIAADGRRIASGGRDNTVRVWDLGTRLQIGDPLDVVGPVFSVEFSPDGRHIASSGNHVYLFDTPSFATPAQGSSSPPTASNRNPTASTTQSISPLRQPKQARTKSPNDTSSINSSLLDLPAVVQQQLATQCPQERKPSVDDDWDTDSIRPRLRPTESQQDPPPDQEAPPVQPTATGRTWSRIIRERWRLIRLPKSHVPANISDGSSHHPPGEHPIVPVSPGLLTDPQTHVPSTPQPPVSGHARSRTIRERWERIRPRKSRVPTDLPDSSLPIPLHERPAVPASPGLPTDPQARPDGDADARGNAQTSSRIRPLRDQSEVSPPIAANVALGKAYDRMAAAPPRDRNERRRWKARQRRRAARNHNMDSDSDSESEPEDNDAESYYEDTGCLDAFCFLECCRWWRHRRSQ